MILETKQITSAMQQILYSCFQNASGNFTPLTLYQNENESQQEINLLHLAYYSDVMNLSKLLLVHALVTLAAGVVLILSPETIPATVNIQIQSPQYLLCYFLGAAEIALAYLSFFSRKLSDNKSLKLIIYTFIFFHMATAAVEAYCVMQGGSAKIWVNILLRIIVSLLFIFYAPKKK